MAEQKQLGGGFTFAGTPMRVERMGYGAMQLAGPHVWGPPKDRAAAVAVLRAAVEAGVNHIDTSDFYGPHVTNQIIREALHPYPEELVLVTKVGARRGEGGSWLPATSREELRAAVEDNLRNLGLERLRVVNLRLMDGVKESVAEQMAVLVEMQREGLIAHLGMSNVTAAQMAEVAGMVEVVCVQNEYNLAHRKDDGLIEELAGRGIAYVPFFPLGGFTPLQSSELDEVARSMGKTPMQVALAWLLQRSPNILLIPGTSSVGHLRENLEAARVELPAAVVAQLDEIGGAGGR